MHSFFEQFGHDPSCLYLCGFLSFLCFGISTCTGNVSQVDKLWSIAPCVYAWMAVNDRRTLVMAVLVTLWGVRLSYNFNRRGGYTFPYIWQGDEDYRWPILRSGSVPYLSFLKHKVPWILFNLVFISVFQNILLLLIVSPSLIAAAASPSSPSFDLFSYDGVAVFFFLLFLSIETIADNQQFAFQTEKYRRIARKEPLTGDYHHGFLHQSGLYKFVRKPNYAAEQALWISYYLFSVAAMNGRHNCSVVGCCLLVLLFQGSGWMTELMTQRKYQTYTEYKKQVPLYVPSILQVTQYLFYNTNKNRNDYNGQIKHN